MQRNCPICDKPVPYTRGKPLPEFFPFCSERCRMVDLGKWVTGEYSISRLLTPGEQLEEFERRRSLDEEGRGEVD
jgi:endogenous inhibitor of DNA gyrase (YacG/DUF329 family)